MEIKDRIALQAGELFMAHGVKSISVDEIASKLGMSKRTIYQQFHDKEDILIHFLELLEAKQNEEMEQLHRTLPTVVDVFMRVIYSHQEVMSGYSVKFQEDIEKYYPKAWNTWKEQEDRGTVVVKHFLMEGIQQGVIRRDLNVEVTAFLLQDTNNTFLQALRMANRSFTIWELFYTMLTNFIRGISTEKGIAIVDSYLNSELTKK